MHRSHRGHAGPQLHRVAAQPGRLRLHGPLPRPAAAPHVGAAQRQRAGARGDGQGAPADARPRRARHVPLQEGRRDARGRAGQLAHVHPADRRPGAHRERRDRGAGAGASGRRLARRPHLGRGRRRVGDDADRLFGLAAALPRSDAPLARARPLDRRPDPLAPHRRRAARDDRADRGPRGGLSGRGAGAEGRGRRARPGPST